MVIDIKEFYEQRDTALDAALAKFWSAPQFPAKKTLKGTVAFPSDTFEVFDHFPTVFTASEDGSDSDFSESTSETLSALAAENADENVSLADALRAALDARSASTSSPSPPHLRAVQKGKPMYHSGRPPSLDEFSL